MMIGIRDVKPWRLTVKDFVRRHGLSVTMKTARI